MAVCTIGAEWASESAYFSGPHVQIVQAILRRTLRDFAQTPPISMGRATAAESPCEAKKGQQRAERHRTPCFKRRLPDSAEDYDWLSGQQAPEEEAQAAAVSGFLSFVPFQILK